MILDSPRGYGTRLEFLGIVMSAEEQLAWHSEANKQIEAAILANTKEVQTFRGMIERMFRSAHMDAVTPRGASFDRDPHDQRPRDPNDTKPHSSEAREAGEDSFLLYDPNILDNLHDVQFFVKAVAQFYALLANTHGCTITISQRRLIETHNYFQQEYGRTDHVDGADKSRTYFAIGGIIAAALMRAVPINDVWFTGKDQDVPSESPTHPQIRFSQLGNEIGGLYCGFYICLACEVSARFKKQSGPHLTIISEAVGVRRLPTSFVREFPSLLRRQPPSASAMQMLYQSLFETLEWEVARPSEV